MARKDYQIDEVLRQLGRKGVRIKGYNFLDLSKAERLGNKSLGKIDFLIKKGYYIDSNGWNDYKKKNNLLPLKEEKSTLIPRENKKREVFLPNGKQILKLAWGSVPSCMKVNIPNRRTFQKSHEEERVLKKEKGLWKKAIERGEFQKELITIIRMET